MAQGRSLWKEVFINFINSFKPRSSLGVLKGKDYLGNEYYESPESSHGRRRRWFVPQKTDIIHDEIPTEWEAWLRFRRRVPPTEEEIQLNIQKMKNVKENVKKLEMQNNNKTDKVNEITSNKSKFPEYEEYNLGPLTEDQKNSEKI